MGRTPLDIISQFAFLVLYVWNYKKICYNIKGRHFYTDPSTQKFFCPPHSKKYLKNKSNFHSLVINRPLSIKLSFLKISKIFEANFASQKKMTAAFSKKSFESKPHFHSLVMNSPLMIKYPYLTIYKIFEANFACNFQKNFCP